MGPARAAWCLPGFSELRDPLEPDPAHPPAAHEEPVDLPAPPGESHQVGAAEHIAPDRLEIPIDPPAGLDGEAAVAGHQLIGHSQLLALVGPGILRELCPSPSR